MCGRYLIGPDISAEEMDEIIAEANRKALCRADGLSAKVGEVAPADVVPVIANSKARVPTPFLMKWGFAGADGKGVLINARSETALEKPMFRKPLLERRCLVPATCYYEWEKHESKRIKYAIRPAGSEMMYMAGIYRFEAGKSLPVFVILTCAPAEEIAHIHNRMPVILTKAQQEQWLKPDADVLSILASAKERMEYRQAANHKDYSCMEK